MILVLDKGTEDYGKAVKGIGHLTSNCKLFFKFPQKFNLVLFTGGADVDPSFYNDDSPNKLCGSNLARDKFEKTIFKHAINNHIPMIGICRGFQFLNVMAKGRLMHHINGHGGTIHSFSGPSLKEPISVNSFHHQMVIPATNTHVIGHSVDPLPNICYGKYDELEEWHGPGIEAAIFPEINSCGVQYHPEWMLPTSEGFLFFYDMANKLIHWPMDKFIQFYTKKDGTNSCISTCHSNTTG